MTQLLAIRQIIKALVGKYENYLRPIGKFLLTFITLAIIKGNIGYSSKIGNTAIMLILSLLASFMPLNFIPVIAVLAVFLDMYAMSLTCALVVGIIVLIMFLLYFRFSPKDTILLMLTPIFFVWKIPYVMPLVAGLVAGPTAMVSVGCGAVMYYTLKLVNANYDALAGNGISEILTDLTVIIDSFIDCREMLVIILAFAVTIVVVSIIRRLPVDHSWTIAIITGTLLDIVIVLAGDLKLGTYISIAGLIWGSILAVLVVIVIKFFAFNVDYSRTEKVTFEDDEYVYYVKAVPKNTYSPKKKHKKNKNSSRPHEAAEAKPRKYETLREEIPEENSEDDYEEMTGQTVEMIDLGDTMDFSINADSEFSSKKKAKNEFPEIKEEEEALPVYTPASQRMTGIERAAAAKARKAREEKN